MSSKLDEGQIVQDVHDTVNHALQVSIVGGGGGSNVTVVNAAGASAVNIQDGGNSITVDGTVAATQSGTWNIADITGTVSLPTGAATAANQTTEITSLQLLDDTVATTGAAITAKGIAAVGTDGTNARVLKTDAAGELQIDVLTQPALSHTTDSVRIGDGTDLALVTAAGELNVLATAQPGVDVGDVTINNAAGASAVNVQDGGNSLTVDGSLGRTWVLSNGTDSVVSRMQDGDGNNITSDAVGAKRGLHTIELGSDTSEFIRNDYSSVNVTTAAYTQLIASTGNNYNEIELFDSSGQTLKIAFGAAASEVDKFLVVPGGNGRIKYRTPSGTRVSIRAVSANATAGEVSINLYGTE